MGLSYIRNDNNYLILIINPLILIPFKRQTSFKNYLVIILKVIYGSLTFCYVYENKP